MAKSNTGLVLGLGAGALALWYFMSKRSPVLQTVTPMAPGPTLIDPKLQFLLNWASGDPNPLRTQFVQSLNPAEVQAMYTIVHDYFDNNIVLPPDQQAVWDQIAGPWGYG